MLRESPARAWIEAAFGAPGPKVFIEAGAHRFEDTDWLARIPGVVLYALEPDPRNLVFIEGTDAYRRQNVVLHRKAIAAHDGTCRFVLSDRHRNPLYHHSFSSIRAPTGAYRRYPYVRFGEWIDVACTTLDTLAREHAIERVDLIWADTQGAERDLIEGGGRTLAATRYLFTEYCPDGEEWYEGQATYSDLLAMLPDFEVVQRWPEDVLLENRRWSS